MCTGDAWRELRAVPHPSGKGPPSTPWSPSVDHPEQGSEAVTLPPYILNHSRTQVQYTGREMTRAHLPPLPSLFYHISRYGPFCSLQI